MSNELAIATNNFSKYMHNFWIILLITGIVFCILLIIRRLQKRNLRECEKTKLEILEFEHEKNMKDGLSKETIAQMDESIKQCNQDIENYDNIANKFLKVRKYWITSIIHSFNY